MESLPQVNIVILNWNGLEDTLECLESLRNIDYPNYKIIIVDNHSTGDDVKLIKEKYGNDISKLIVTDQNLGFSGGNNIGIDYSVESGAEYILLLNNDTVVEKDFLTILVNEAQSDEIGIVSPMIAYFSDNEKIWSAGGNINKLKASGFSFGHNKNVENFNYKRICSFASGCCMLIKSKIIKEIGKLDENYFLYLEDTDYCYRAIKADYKILFVGSSKIYHKVHSTTAKTNSLMPIYYSTRNRLYFARKNLGMIFYISFIYLVMAFSLKWIFVLDEKREAGLIIMKAFGDYFRDKMGQNKYFKSNG